MFPQKHRVLLGLISVGVILIGIAVYFYMQHMNTRGASSANITSFDECVKAGNPVLDSYPQQCKTQDGKSFAQYIGNELEMMDVISIDNPRPNQEIASPLMIKGRARGPYFFEATFPIRLVDDAGNELAEGYVEAQGEWMTEEFVPFIGELEFETNTPSGTLYLEKANPSGLPENDQVLEVPVVFISE